MVDSTYSSQAVSLAELKRNTTRVVRLAKTGPVAVLKHGKPAVYVLSPAFYEALLDELEDYHWTKIVRDRLANKDDVVMVDLDEL